MATSNKEWNLEDFLDSLVVELDKTRETLAVKAINKPLTYTVKDLAIDLNIFPSYDGDQIRFITAQPGQQGASKVTIQLGSITDQQVRATTKIPGMKNDTKIEEIDVDKETKKKLRKIGVTSVSDLKQVESKQVDIEKVSDNTIDYKALANKIQKAKRAQAPPVVRSASLSVDENKQPYLVVRGENLAMHASYEPVALINQKLAKVVSSTTEEIKVRLSNDHDIRSENELILTLDPYALVKLSVKM
jgi:hypothetical protein